MFFAWFTGHNACMENFHEEKYNLKMKTALYYLYNLGKTQEMK